MSRFSPLLAWHAWLPGMEAQFKNWLQKGEVKSDPDCLGAQSFNYDLSRENARLSPEPRLCVGSTKSWKRATYGDTVIG